MNQPYTPQPMSTYEVFPMEFGFENKTKRISINTSNDDLPILIEAASEFEGVSVNVLPVETEEQALQAANQFELIEYEKERLRGPAPSSQRRIGATAMAKYMFDSREARSPIVINMDGVNDLGTYWKRVDELKAEKQA